MQNNTETHLNNDILNNLVNYAGNLKLFLQNKSLTTNYMLLNNYMDKLIHDIDLLSNNQINRLNNDSFNLLKKEIIIEPSNNIKENSYYEFIIDVEKSACLILPDIKDSLWDNQFFSFQEQCEAMIAAIKDFKDILNIAVY
jgi:hypothetical protein